MEKHNESGFWEDMLPDTKPVMALPTAKELIMLAHEQSPAVSGTGGMG